VAYNYLASCSSFYAWASSLSATACLLVNMISITSRCFCLTSAFYFLEVVRFLSKETHTKRRSHCLLMSSLSRRSTSCTRLSAKWVMPITSEKETAPAS
jgi:hypothetical protein